MARSRSVQDQVTAWRVANEMTATALAEAVGDPSGQVVKWLNGSRNRLPLKLKVKLAWLTEIPLKAFCKPEEMELARDLFAVLAREAAA